MTTMLSCAINLTNKEMNVAPILTVLLACTLRYLRAVARTLCRTIQPRVIEAAFTGSGTTTVPLVVDSISKQIGSVIDQHSQGCALDYCYSQARLTEAFV